jgi:hypothetical protein
VSAGGAEAVDSTVLAAAIVWTVPTVFVLLFNALFFEVMQWVLTFALFVLPTAILWAQAIAHAMRGDKGGEPRGGEPNSDPLPAS